MFQIYSFRVFNPENKVSRYPTQVKPHETVSMNSYMNPLLWLMFYSIHLLTGHLKITFRTFICFSYPNLKEVFMWNKSKIVHVLCSLWRGHGGIQRPESCYHDRFSLVLWNLEIIMSQKHLSEVYTPLTHLQWHGFNMFIFSSQLTASRVRGRTER